MNRKNKEQLIGGRTKKCFSTEYTYAVPRFCKTQENQNDILHGSTDVLVTSAIT